jgi:DNA mismatch repair protein MutS
MGRRFDRRVSGPTHYSKTQLSSTLQRISPKEILVPESDSVANALLEFRDCLSRQAPLYFESERGRARLQSLFGVETIESFGAFSRAEISAAGALIDYIERTQKGNLPHLSRPKKTSSDDVLEIDPSTLRNLELARTLSGEKRGSLLSTIDRTLTGAGARMLQSRLVAPLRNLKEIEQRHNEIEYFIQIRPASESICSLLKSIPDMERALARLSMNRGGPRDLVALNVKVLRGQPLSARSCSKTELMKPPCALFAMPFQKHQTSREFGIDWG